VKCLRNSNATSELVRGVLPYLILRLVEKQAFHGYRVIKALRQKFGVYFGPSTIYPMLKSLTAKGMLTVEMRFSSTQRPCKIYTLTEKGAVTLQEMKSTMEMIWTISRNMGDLPKEDYVRVVTTEVQARRIPEIFLK